MKKTIITGFLTGMLALTGIAQDDHAQHQSNAQGGKSISPSVSQLLNSYYAVNDALAKDNSKTAAAKASEFVKAANAIDYKVISEGNITALLKDASKIAGSTDINVQRKHFANLSQNMVALAKSMKLSADPIYQAYCPMKQANWLTPEKVIKNPYYGSSMLTCGSITATIQ